VHPVGLKIWYWANLPHDKSFAPLCVSFGLQPKETMAAMQPSGGALCHQRQAKQPIEINYNQFEIF